MSVWKKDVNGVKPREGVRISGSASPRVGCGGYANPATGDALVSNPSRKRWRLKMFPSSKHKKADFRRRRSLNTRERKEQREQKRHMARLFGWRA